MANINFTVPNEKLQRIVDAMKGLYPIPFMEEFVEDKGMVQVPDFTDNQWAKEAMRRLVIRDVKRWETKKAKTSATSSIQQDDSLIA